MSLISKMWNVLNSDTSNHSSPVQPIHSTPINGITISPSTSITLTLHAHAPFKLPDPANLQHLQAQHLDALKLQKSDPLYSLNIYTKLCELPYLSHIIEAHDYSSTPVLLDQEHQQWKKRFAQSKKFAYIVCLNRASILYRLKRFEESLKWFHHTRSLDPSNARVWRWMGATSIRLMKFALVKSVDLFRFHCALNAFERGRELAKWPPDVFGCMEGEVEVGNDL